MIDFRLIRSDEIYSSIANKKVFIVHLVTKFALISRCVVVSQVSSFKIEFKHSNAVDIVISFV